MTALTGIDSARTSRRTVRLRKNAGDERAKTGTAALAAAGDPFDQTIAEMLDSKQADTGHYVDFTSDPSRGAVLCVRSTQSSASFRAPTRGTTISPSATVRAPPHLRDNPAPTHSSRKMLFLFL
eukprot:3337898-Pleurochrysis_carterae.AAC.1